MAWKLIGTASAVAFASVMALAATQDRAPATSNPIQVVPGPAPKLQAPSPVARTTVAVTSADPTVAPRAARIKMLVPAYFYPEQGGSDWDAMTAAAAKVGVVAIMNPASGPDPVGHPLNSDYVRAVNAFRAAGGIVLGYVPSGYSGRRVHGGSSCKPASGHTYTAADVADCAARYAGYHVDGIFVDEMGVLNGRPQSEAVTFYTDVYDRLKTTDATWTVIGNPGTDAPESYLRKGRSGGADTLVTYEDAASGYAAATPSPYTANYPAKRFANILHTAQPGYDFPGVLATARARNVGYIYATDDVLPNPYDRLPSDWTRQVKQLARFNRGN